MSEDATWLEKIKWNVDGLVSAVAQDQASGRVLTQAWMTREALQQTVATGQAVYWSRSRRCLWRKGEKSGHTQTVREIRLDCDQDSILLLVDQAGGIACHTGRQSCFYLRFEDGQWREADPVLRDPDIIYGNK